LDMFFTCAGRIDKWSLNVRAGMPKPFCSACVELGNGLREFESWVTTDFARLEVTTWSPPVTILISTIRIRDCRTNLREDVHLESADGAVSCLVICHIGNVIVSPEKGLPWPKSLLLFDTDDADVISEDGLVPRDGRGSVLGHDPHAPWAVSHDWGDLIHVHHVTSAPGEAGWADALTTNGRNDAIHSARNPIVSIPRENQSVVNDWL